MSLIPSLLPVGASLLAIKTFCAAKNRQQAGAYRKPERGFTLVELIMVIALAGIVAVMIATVMTRPLQGFADQSRRAELTDLAAMALNRMARDIRLAVPNSLRNEPGCLPETKCHTLEMLEISEGGRYRANIHSAGGERFDPPRCPGKGEGDCLIPVLSPGVSVGNAKWMVIYSTDEQVWSPVNAGAEAAVITPNDASVSLIDCPSENLINSDGEVVAIRCVKLDNAEGFSFKYASPQHRFYLVSGAVGYKCVYGSNGYGELRRAEVAGLSPSYDQRNSALVVDHVSECSFTYSPGTNTRNGLVTLRLTLKDRETEEAVTLLQQVHIDNAP